MDRRTRRYGPVEGTGAQAVRHCHLSARAQRRHQHQGWLCRSEVQISGSEDRAGGLVWRAQDANNYYVVRANALEDNVVLYKTVNGVRNSLDIVRRKGGYGVKTAVPANQWHALRVEFAGTRFKVIFNEKALFEVEDATFAGPGMVGLWTKADSVTAFNAFGFGEAK
jgi:hypothetical protein